MRVALCLLWMLPFAAGNLLGSSRSQPDIIRIGNLFDGSDPVQEVAFRYAIERVNANRNVLARNSKSKLTVISERLPPNDSFTASKKVCQMFRNGVAAIFGPASDDSCNHVQSMCETVKVPHVQTRWNLMSSTSPLAINLHPHPSSLSKAYWDVIKAYGWRTFTVLYDNDDSLYRLQDLLSVSTRSGYRVVVRQLHETDDYRPLLKEMKKMNERNIVLDCNVDRVDAVLEQAQQVGLMTLAHSYFITSLNVHLVNMDKFKYSGVNITGIQLIDSGRIETSNAVAEWLYGETRYGRTLELSESTLPVEAALIYDSVLLFARALNELDRNDYVQMRPLNCDGTDTWTHGLSLVSYMKMIEIDGLTGPIKFDDDGLRTNFNLNVVEMAVDGLHAVGTWNTADGANFTRVWIGMNNKEGDSLFNKTLIVSSILSNPYFMLKESGEILAGNDRFEGFVFDIIDEISKMLGFHYQFKLVDDGKYGSMDKETGEWNGMIRELLDGKADLALGDLSINFDREKAVDFTMPFLNTGISILYKKPQKQESNLFSFLSPFSVEVWIYTCTAYLGMSITLFALSRLTPYEWQNPHPCRQQPDILENNFTILNSMWFTIGSLLQQGCDFLPKATSTRTAAIFWWFFTLIMISSYTANLAAFLTAGLMESPITSAEDLAKQTKIKYGSVGSGSTLAFFRDSTIPTYQRMWQFMETTSPSVFTRSNMEGVERVQRSNGQYAFMMEMTSIEFFTERRCDLTQVGGALDSKGYGIAMRPGSPYRAALSQAVLKMQETNRLLILKNKWWKERRGGGVCTNEGSTDTSAAAELGLANVGGVFMVLTSGLIVAALVALCEFAWKSRKLAIHREGGVLKEMCSELKSAISCSGNTKPVRRLE